MSTDVAKHFTITHNLQALDIVLHFHKIDVWVGRRELFNHDVSGDNGETIACLFQAIFYENAVVVGDPGPRVR